MEIPRFVSIILDCLEAGDFQAFIVGGAVRDIHLNRIATDWDVATSATPDEIRSVFHHIRHFSLKHDTVTLVDEGQHFEVTSFRGAGNFGKTIEEDLGHRDFTINAMAYDPSSERIIDPHGGRKDISKKCIRAVRDPRKRLDEDPLRLLRAVRLSTELGFKVEPGTFACIADMAPRLAGVAKERLREELVKILMAKKPSFGFNLMIKAGLLDHFLPELREGYLKRQNRFHRFTIYRHIMESIDRVEPDLVLRLVALFHDIAKPRVRKKTGGEFRFYGHEKASAELAAEIMERFKFGKELIGKVALLVSHHMVSYEKGWSDAAVRRFISRLGPENVDDLLCFRKADLLAHGVVDQKMKQLEALKKRVKKIRRLPLPVKRHDLAIDGKRVMALTGLNPGPEVGRILKDLMKRVIDHPEMNTEQNLIEALEKMKKE